MVYPVSNFVLELSGGYDISLSTCFLDRLDMHFITSKSVS